MLQVRFEGKVSVLNQAVLKQSLENDYGVWRVLRLAALEKKKLALGFIFLVLSSAALLVYPQIIQRMIDQALRAGEIGSLQNGMSLILAIFVVQAGAGALRYYYFTIAGEQIVARLRSNLYTAIVNQEIAFFDERRTGELLSRLSADATVLQNAVSVNISMLTRNLGAAVGGIALLVYTSPKLALGLLLALPPLALGTAGFGRRIRVLSRQFQDALAETGNIAEETLAGIRTVRSFAQEQSESRRYSKAVQAALLLARKRISFIAVFTAAASLMGYLAIVGVLYYGSCLVIAKELSIGELTSFFLYTMTVAISVATLGSLWTDFMAATGAGRRIFEILDRVPAMQSTGGMSPQKIAGEICFQSVSFRYPARADVEVLKKIQFALRPGESVALVGPSGSGKSTIAALLSRFYDPSGGRITLDGLDILDLNPHWLRLQVGTVAQDPVLMSSSILSNIRYGKEEATLSEVEAVAKAANADQFIRAFPDGYETVVGERGVQLSGGQRQRVAIARAMLKDPRILVLDEATSALDAESEHLVKEALDRLMVGRTTLVIAHRLSTVRAADRIMVMDRGEIVQVGRHEELMRDQEGVYYKLVYLQTLALQS